MLKWILTGFEEADCSRVAQDRDMWQALVNTVISLPESIKCGIIS
jgi:hypothetical protein